MRWVVVNDGRYTVHADVRDGGAVGLYVTDEKGATQFFLIPAGAAPAVAAVLARLADGRGPEGEGQR